MGIPRFWEKNQPAVQTLIVGTQAGIIPSTGIAEAHFKASAANVKGKNLTAKARRQTARSVWFNLDNGAGATVDDVILCPTTAITITGARIIYVDATTGTVAGATAQIGTTVTGEQIVAATNYQNSKAVGSTTAMSIVSGAVAANTPVIVRHTGVAETQAGQAVVQIEYQVDDA